MISAFDPSESEIAFATKNQKAEDPIELDSDEELPDLSRSTRNKKTVIVDSDDEEGVVKPGKRLLRNRTTRRKVVDSDDDSKCDLPRVAECADTCAFTRHE